MSISGLCQICEANTADHDCARCGRLVCGIHYDEQSELCAECASETTGEPTRADRDTFQF